MLNNVLAQFLLLKFSSLIQYLSDNLRLFISQAITASGSYIDMFRAQPLRTTY